MDKELAESYVQYQIDQTKQDKKIFILSLFLFFGLWVANLIFYQSLAFYIIAAFIILTYVIAVIVYCKKPKPKIFFLLSAITLLYLCVTFNCLCFTIIRKGTQFNLVNYLTIILLQIVSFSLSIPLNIFIANRHQKNKKAINGEVWASIGGGIGATCYFFGKVISQTVSTEIMTWITPCVLIIISWLGSYVISRSVYCAVLIGKFKLNVYNKYNPKLKQVENTEAKVNSDNSNISNT